MKFWQAITWAETDQLVEIARFAEELGFTGLMSGDHALYPMSLAGGYPYSPTGMPPQTAHTEYADMWTSFAAMAAVTSRLKFVCGVYVLPLRNPIEVAKQAATLALLSQGRFVLGAGAGWMKEEFDIYGVDFASRGARMDEMLDILEGLWKGEPFAFKGDHFQFEEITVTPYPKGPIPVYFGGAKGVALRRAARRGAGWINTGDSAEQLLPVLDKLHALRAEYGRADQPFETLCGLYDKPDPGLYRDLAEKGMTSTIHLPFSFALGEHSSIDDKKRMMERYAEDIIQKV